MSEEYKHTNVACLCNEHFSSKKTDDGIKLMINHPEFKGKVGLIKFYAPWCGHCTNMVPTLIGLSNEMKENVIYGSVDCTDEDKDNHTLATNIGIEGFPTIYTIHPSGSLELYEEGRDKKSIEAYMEKQLEKLESRNEKKRLLGGKHKKNLKLKTNKKTK
jgi:thioredoxin-like negative regulator of GroEL